MEKKYIMNIINANKVCECDLTNKSFKEIEKTKDIIMSKGIYSKVLDSKINLFGIIASSTGPVIFCDNNFTVLQNINFNFIFKNLTDNKGNFKIIINDKVFIDINYTKPNYGYDVWSDEDEVDIFQWILEFVETDESKKNFLIMFKEN